MTNLLGIGANSGHWKKNSTHDKLEPVTVFPEEVKTINQVVSDYRTNILFLSDEGKIYETNNDRYKEKLKAHENLPPIKSVHTGYHHFFAMSDEPDPKVYGWGFNNYCQLGLPVKKTYDKPTLVNKFKEIKIHEIHPMGYASVFLDTENHILYGCGNNSSGQTAINKNTTVVETITKSQEDVIRVFTGFSAHSYLEKSDGHLYAFGSSLATENIKSSNSNNTLSKMELEFSANEIKKIAIGVSHTIILLNDGRAYVVGVTNSTGFASRLNKFEQYPQFKNNNTIFKDVACGYSSSGFLAENNEIWVAGRFKSNTISPPAKLTNLEQNSNISLNTLVASGSNQVFFALELDLINYLNQDLLNLLENGSFADCQIQSIPVHKVLIQIRIGKPFDEVKKYLEENCTLKEIKDLLKWIYGDRRINFKRTNEILNNFGIENPKETKTLKSDLKKLLFDENTSDFTLMVQNDEYEEEEGEEEEEEEEEELPVHKFILAARSGLFLNMFQNLDQKNLKKVKDYSNKSLETIELLISFLYTDEIPITADHDQEFIKEEFEDIVEYYQLNPKIHLLKIFEKCAKN
ncbi:hypothetical protein M0813_12345 [Anaeramoeba flamelloides]|uniref:BTB domain-containing protein n=1 Tax=Anaeramoeba flamelloides TaxID=1746091 RepID=A0ABQ8ZCC2_9EUKA|nr:hypothetical protein M0813_12345 [Anaeramoeba flamelloides]